MEFRNHTPFPALAFEGIDQLERAFHVIALRQTLTWEADGILVYAEEQEPLCEVDEYFGELNRSSLRQESDLCHYKPKCDVILNATAHAPQGISPQRINVRLVVSLPDTDAPLPRRPQGMNQFTEPNPTSLAKWQEAVLHAQNHPVKGERLIDKTLTVTGERELVRTGWPMRLLASVARVCSLGTFKGGKWRLTAPKPITSVVLHYENAYGGECRLDQNDPRAKKLREKDRLPTSQGDEHAASANHNPNDAAALSTFESNPVGRGYVAPWFLQATKADRLPAPQIEWPGVPFTVGRFVKMQDTENHHPEAVSTLLAGFGVRAKVHPQRRALCGTIDQRFVDGAKWLPDDFDFGIWNAAPPDQQTDYLRGDACIELTNLSAPGSPGTRVDNAGNTVLPLKLPGHCATLLVRMTNGTMFFHPMKIDTLIVEPEDRKVSLVWRAVLEKTGDIRALEANLHKEFEAEFTRHIDEGLNKMDADSLLASLALPLEEQTG